MKISGETALLLAVVYALLASAVGQQDGIENNNQYIESIAELSTAILAGPNRKVGAVSAVNFASVANLLPNITELAIYNTTDQIVTAITKGDIIAGMISGPAISDPDRKLFSFASTIISPRGFLFKNEGSQSAIDMIDAAIVRMAHAGEDNQLALDNPPFDYLGIQTCKPDPLSNYPFPSTVNATGVLADILTSGKLKMGYIPVDMIQDGDYTQIPPTQGFFPQYMDRIVHIINENMGTNIQIDRSSNYSAYSSSQLLTMVNAGTIHTVEPYFSIDAFFQNRARKRAFALSCVVLGRTRDDSRFYTKRPSTSSSKKALTPGQTAGVVIAVVVAVIGTIMVGLMIWHERKGKPLFAPLQTVPAHEDDMGRGKEMASPHAIAMTKDPDTHHL